MHFESKPCKSVSSTGSNRTDWPAAKTDEADERNARNNLMREMKRVIITAARIFHPFDGFYSNDFFFPFLILFSSTFASPPSLLRISARRSRGIRSSRNRSARKSESERERNEILGFFLCAVARVIGLFRSNVISSLFPYRDRTRRVQNSNSKAITCQARAARGGKNSECDPAR